MCYNTLRIINSQKGFEMNITKRYLQLFLSFFKIGLFTFGGGYAMIALIEREFVEKLQLITHEEFIEIVAIAESTPGPIAINSATYIGYKAAKVLGSFFCTLGVCIPSFVIIYTISLFFDAFLAAEYIGYAFRGIQACVSYLIISAGLKMFKKMEKTLLNKIMLGITVLALLFVTLFSVNVSSILFILAGAVVGVAAYVIRLAAKKEGKGGNN